MSKGIPMGRAAWIIIASAATIVTLALGIRQGLAMFLRPISMDLELGRQVFGLSLAIQTIVIGFGNPVAGALADRFGHVKVSAFGAVLYGVSLLLAASAQSPTGLHLTFGVLMGIALSAVSMSVLFGAVARVVPPERRTLAFGIITSGGSLGQFLVVPVANSMMTAAGWRLATSWLAVATLAMLVLIYATRAAQDAPRRTGGEAASLSQALGEARVHSGYWLLTASFFVCGFHVSLISSHLPAFFLDRGLSPAIAAQAYALVGLFNIFGSYYFGWAASRWRKGRVLAFIYGARAVIFIPLLLLPTTPELALAFSAAMGFIYLGTVAPTSGIVAQVFGVRYLSTLFGIVFLSHQAGGFLGAWLAGLLFDTTGSYDIVWELSIALGVLGMLLCLPINEKPLRPAPAPAAAG